MKKLVAIAASVLAVASVLVGFQIAGPSAHQEPASALSGSSFQAGNIISDANFYNGTSMTVDQVQSFLNAQVSSCTNSGCLRNGRYSMNSRSADAMCGAVTGGSSLSTAQILTRVGAACGISPKVMLVTLQKEQGLVTSRGPSAAVLERAMGYACPDNVGGHCDPAYAGVGNQIYWSAWQWKRYGNPPGTSNYFTWFNPGGTRAIQYNVPTSCGTKSVAVQNKATAALYYYTPYTPNTAALNNLYGTGDGCSAYGNRNFWRMYNDWFGSTTGTPPVVTAAKGSFDGLTSSYNTVTVNGWALDTRTKASTRVQVTVGSATRTVTANGNRPDIARAYPKLGAKHGFTASVSAPVGSQQVCVSALTAAGKTKADLGCKTVIVADGSPHGSLDRASAAPGGVSVAGWAIDPETPKSIGVSVSSDGAFVKKLSGAKDRPDVARAYPKAGAAHGFAATVPVPAGSHRICVTGANTGKGSDAVIGTCKTVNVPGSRPIGSVDSVTATPTSVGVTGWALDGDSKDPIQVDVSVDGVVKRVDATGSRPDVAKTFPAYGSARGFSVTVPAGRGKHEVCVRARNVGKGNVSPSLGCRTVTVVNAAPIGSLDDVQVVKGGVSVSGWAIDLDKTGPISVDLSVDATVKRVTASKERADIGRAHPKAGPAHAFAVTLPTAAGTHEVCAQAIDSAGGVGTALGCRTVTVP
ncbi:hypothetical protein DEJ34_10110 [Curtobacterium sp. MCPF17_050]|uniref:hypothetical protein n=1 Tax=unclassified Curtobacterium TaxID=257496 RepID=UPI000D88EAE7|nr:MULTISPECIES: hypothetical protein [unclassified Curtobacterium]PYY50053.1 hypothetical protein DEI84_05100 [Curtobacterium sp. MCBD17_023]WIB14515.1 hypothetical protein DEJ34_10110 [Curtobacterium sp. MCPF17_050]